MAVPPTATELHRFLKSYELEKHLENLKKQGVATGGMRLSIQECCIVSDAISNMEPFGGNLSFVAALLSTLYYGTSNYVKLLKCPAMGYSADLPMTERKQRLVANLWTLLRSGYVSTLWRAAETAHTSDYNVSSVRARTRYSYFSRGSGMSSPLP